MIIRSDTKRLDDKKCGNEGSIDCIVYLFDLFYLLIILLFLLFCYSQICFISCSVRLSNQLFDNSSLLLSSILLLLLLLLFNFLFSIKCSLTIFNLSIAVF